MSKYLKLFETTSQYNEYINGSDVVLPNVSVAKDALTTVYFNPYVEQPFNVIIYTATEKLEEQSSGSGSGSGSGGNNTFDKDGFQDENGQPLRITSHTFENGVGTIEFDGDVTSIGDNAFRGCTSLTSITIPDSVTSIGEQAFDNCTSLTDVTIPNGVTSIGSWAFYNCSGLTSVTIGSNVTSIGNSAFSSCASLTSIIVDSGNTVFDSRDNCNAIINTSTNKLIAGCKNTVIPDSVTSIGNAAFQQCSSLKNITIPNSVTSIDGYVFYDCTSLTRLNSDVDGLFNIPDSVTNIGYNAFNGCSSLTSVTIPNSVTSIGENAFNDCKGLTSVTIGSGVTSIGYGAFQSCTGLTSIICNATAAPTITNTTFNNVKTGGTLTVPSGSSGYNVWMGTGNYYLGKYNWTKTEQ